MTTNALFPQYDPNVIGLFHHDIEINENLRTSHLGTPYSEVHQFSKHDRIANFLEKIYKEDFKNKTAISIACNAGGQLFECQKKGIKEGYGFDIRELWINQANWLKENITSYSTDNLTFKTHSLDELSTDKHYDISFFDGIFYHLANPFLHLSKVASITNEILTINTAYDSSIPDSKPALIFKLEGKLIEQGLTGVEGVSWLPNGEDVLKSMLRQLGFSEFRMLFKNPRTDNSDRGRLCLIASKIPGLLR